MLIYIRFNIYRTNEIAFFSLAPNLILDFPSFRILVFRESPILLFTGLNKKCIGNPREYEKNVAEGDEYFEKVEIDMTIPLEETDEWE